MAAAPAVGLLRAAARRGAGRATPLLPKQVQRRRAIKNTLPPPPPPVVVVVDTPLAVEAPRVHCECRLDD